MYNCFIESGFIFKNLIIVPTTNTGLGDLKASFIKNYETIIYCNKGRREFSNSTIKKPSRRYLKDKRHENVEYLKRLPAIWDWCRSTDHNLNLIHPTQKSTEVFEVAIQVSSDEGDLILDPFLGSGTTLEACRRTNRNCIGFEIDPQWEHLYPERCMSYNPPLTEWL